MAEKCNYKVYDCFTKLKGDKYNTFEDEMRGFFSKEKRGDTQLSITSKHLSQASIGSPYVDFENHRYV